MMLVQQSFRSLIVFFNVSLQIKTGQYTVFHDGFSVNVIHIHLARLAEDQRGQRIVQSAGKFQVVEFETNKIGALAGFERTDIFPAQHSCAAAGDNFQCLAGRKDFFSCR